MFRFPFSLSACTRSSLRRADIEASWLSKFITFLFDLFLEETVDFIFCLQILQICAIDYQWISFFSQLYNFYYSLFLCYFFGWTIEVFFPELLLLSVLCFSRPDCYWIYILLFGLPLCITKLYLPAEQSGEHRYLKRLSTFTFLDQSASACPAHL